MQQPLSFGTVIFFLGNGDTPCLRGLLCIHRWRRKCNEHKPDRADRSSNKSDEVSPRHLMAFSLMRTLSPSLEKYLRGATQEACELAHTPACICFLLMTAKEVRPRVLGTTTSGTATGWLRFQAGFGSAVICSSTRPLVSTPTPHKANEAIRKVSANVWST